MFMSLLPPDSPQPKPLIKAAAKGIQYSPDFSFEKACGRQGYSSICGVDEAGRGPLAGPVTAAAVILDPANIPDGLHDSKKLTEAKRNHLFDAILQSSLVSFSHVSARQIDQLNIRAASLLAMRHAVDGLEQQADFALIDGNAIPPGLLCDAQAIIKGDARSLSISAASIVVKVMRDRLMVRAHTFYPEYGLSGHKGYPTQSHRDAVATLGPCAMHRRSFAPVAKALANGAPKPKAKSFQN